MSNQLVLIKNIYQTGKTTFAIEWSDGRMSACSLCLLQRNCPCARCRDEKTGESLVDPSGIPDDLTAHKIVNVGCYAIKIDFKQGCSRGIFTYSFLRKLSLGDM